MTAVVLPSSIRVEASSLCQLRCPSCPTTTRDALPVIGSGWLKFDDFRRLVDANPFVHEVELSNYGEMFLNPELLPILEYAHLRGVALTCDNGANFNTVSDDVLQALVKFGFRSLTCSIDGASEETYAEYRVGGHFETVIANIRRLNELKAQNRSETPFLTWQFVVFGHNEHELPAARRLAETLGMAFVGKLSWDPTSSPVRNAAAVREQLGAATRDDYRDQHGTGYLDDICLQLWDAPQINWDGKILGCCRNFWAEFGGNAFTDGLVPALNDEAISYARRMLTGEVPPRDGIPCSRCPVYFARRASAQWL